MAGYAVIDVETTGLEPELEHRVIEIGVVLTDISGTITDEWATLVNPARDDVGPTDIHGLQFDDLQRAPSFSDIAGTLTRLLAGRVLVAHNLAFDAAFLRGEFERIGAAVPIDPAFGLCTKKLADLFLPDAEAHTLAACCERVGVRLDVAHCALDDARAAAGLLAYFLRQDPWSVRLAAAAQAVWPTLPTVDTSALLRRNAS